jgi:hypothetical protein
MTQKNKISLPPVYSHLLHKQYNCRLLCSSTFPTVCLSIQSYFDKYINIIVFILILFLFLILIMQTRVTNPITYSVTQTPTGPRGVTPTFNFRHHINTKLLRNEIEFMKRSMQKYNTYKRKGHSNLNNIFVLTKKNLLRNAENKLSNLKTQIEREIASGNFKNREEFKKRMEKLKVNKNKIVKEYKNNIQKAHKQYTNSMKQLQEECKCAFTIMSLTQKYRKRNV